MKNWIFGEKSAKHYLALQENFPYEQARMIIVKNKSICILPYFVKNDVALNLTFESLRVIILLTNQGWIVAFVSYKSRYDQRKRKLPKLDYFQHQQHFMGFIPAKCLL